MCEKMQKNELEHLVQSDLSNFTLHLQKMKTFYDLRCVVGISDSNWREMYEMTTKLYEVYIVKKQGLNVLRIIHESEHPEVVKVISHRQLDSLINHYLDDCGIMWFQYEFRLWLKILEDEYLLKMEKKREEKFMKAADAKRRELGYV